MKISVIIPAYNSSQSIRRCLHSLSNQTCENLSEIIVVDDGSTDDLEKIVGECRTHDSRIIYIYQDNGGVSSARNTGIMAATGDYIMFVDSDDEIKNTFIDKLLPGLSRATLTVGGVELHQDCGTTNISYSSLTSVNETIRGYGSAYPSLLLNGPWGKLFSLWIIKEYGIRFDTAVSLGEDTLFVFEYLKHCKYVNFVDDCGYIYYQLGTSSLMMKYRDHAYYIAKEVYQRLAVDCVDICGMVPDNFKKVYKNVLMVYARKLIANRKKSSESVRHVICDYANDDLVRECINQEPSGSLFGKLMDYLTIRKRYLLAEIILRLHVRIRGV